MKLDHLDSEYKGAITFIGCTNLLGLPIYESILLQQKLINGNDGLLRKSIESCLKQYQKLWICEVETTLNDMLILPFLIIHYYI